MTEKTAQGTAPQKTGPVDTVVDDMATASTDRIKKEIKDRKVRPNTLADQIQRALG